MRQIGLEERLARIEATPTAVARALLDSALAEDEEIRKPLAGTLHRRRYDLELSPQDPLPYSIDRRPCQPSRGGHVLTVRQKV